ncbi:hypothetical protein ACIGW7_39855 [Streptomyces sp. NPDC053253]|uniref:hypothetical protein n=1 Tax=Streptomyces sp. NPDC053253 TaxID=3365699 RepID=UPI0037D13598
MTETSPTGDVTPEPPPHPYTETALARLMLSHALRETAECALHGMATGDDASSTVGPGDYVREAARLARLAEDVQRWAAVYERERGTSWEEVGEALNITRQSAHTRFAEHVKKWRAPLDKPEKLLPDGTPDDERIPYGARYAPGHPRPAYGTAEDTARDLDRWLRQHTGPTDHWDDQENPISGGLPRHSTTSMVMLTQRVSHRLLEDQMVPDPQAQADLCDHRVALYERLIREGGTVPTEIHQWIAKDRARAAALRATPGRGVTWDEMAGPEPVAAQHGDDQ